MLYKLPSELLTCIFDHLRFEDLIIVQSTCRSFRNQIHSIQPKRFQCYHSTDDYLHAISKDLFYWLNSVDKISRNYCKNRDSEFVWRNSKCLVRIGKNCMIMFQLQSIPMRFINNGPLNIRINIKSRVDISMTRTQAVSRILDDGVRTFSISLLSSMRNYDTSLVNLGNSDDIIIQTRWINQALDKGYVLKRLSMGTIGYECDYDSPNESNTTLYPEDEAVQFEQPHWQFYEKSRVSKLVSFCGLEGGSTWYQPDDKKALQKYLQLLCKRWKSNYITI